MDQERLQQSLDALGDGLNIDNFDLDDDFDGGGDDSYLALANSFGQYNSQLPLRNTQTRIGSFSFCLRVTY